MSGPHGTAEPPAIVIAWSSIRGAWRATAVISGRIDLIQGPSTAEGCHPADALQALLGKRFGVLSDSECPATMISIGAERGLALP